MSHRIGRLLLSGLLACAPGLALAVVSAADSPQLIAQANPEPRADRRPGDGAWSDVRGFGAHGDGKSDDTKALRDAVAAVKAAGGGVVYLPAGQYRVDPTKAGVIGTAFNFSPRGGDWYAAILIDSDDVTIRCASQRTTFAIAASETGKRTNAVIALRGTPGRPVRRARVEGCSFDLRNQAGAVALYAQHVQELGFVDNAVRNHASGVDAVTLDNTVGAIITRNQWRDGAIATGLYQSSSVTITANSFYNIGEALDADKPVTHGTGLAGHGITVTGNVYDRDASDTTGDAAWEINGFTDVVIADNTIRRSNNGIHLTAKVRNGKSYAAERITIKNNTIEGVNGIGIAMADIDENGFVNHRDIVIEGNVIRGSGREGIRIRGTNVLVRGNIIRGSGGFGIEATQLMTGRAYNANRLTHFVVADNLISDGAKAGIHSDGGIHGTLSGNRVYHNGAGNPSIELIDNEHVIVFGNSTSDGAEGIRIVGGAAWSGGKSLIIGNMAAEPQGFRWAGTSVYTAVGNVGAYIPMHQQQ
jgi:Right handed beta helix region/Pectate lyase superfamily protein